MKSNRETARINTACTQLPFGLRIFSSSPRTDSSNGLSGASATMFSATDMAASPRHSGKEARNSGWTPLSQRCSFTICVTFTIGFCETASHSTPPIAIAVTENERHEPQYAALWHAVHHRDHIAYRSQHRRNHADADQRPSIRSFSLSTGEPFRGQGISSERGFQSRAITEPGSVVG